MADMRDTLITTDYPIDKVVGTITGSILSKASFPYNSNTHSHGLGFTPLCLVKWSTSSGFTSSNDEITDILAPPGTYSLICGSNSTNIKIDTFPAPFSPDATLYYRVVLLAPSNVSTSLAGYNIDSFQLNTDFNYSKIFQEGILASDSGTVTHNLGYYPQVESWYKADFDGRVYHLNYTASSSPVAGPRITTTQLIFNPPAALVSEWHYKIYLDEV